VFFEIDVDCLDPRFVPCRSAHRRTHYTPLYLYLYYTGAKKGGTDSTPQARFACVAVWD